MSGVLCNYHAYWHVTLFTPSKCLCVWTTSTVYPKKYAHGFVVLCFVVVMQSFIMNSHEVFIHIHQGCFAGTGAIVRLPQCQWSKPDGYGKISQCITTTKHSKAKTVGIFLGIYCTIDIRRPQFVCLVKLFLSKYISNTVLYGDVLCFRRCTSRKRFGYSHHPRFIMYLGNPFSFCVRVRAVGLHKYKARVNLDRFYNLN